MRKLTPLSLSNLVRHAFLAGRGLNDGDPVGPRHQEAWAEYEPPEELYKLVNDAAYSSPSYDPSDALQVAELKALAGEAIRNAQRAANYEEQAAIMFSYLKLIFEKRTFDL